MVVQQTHEGFLREKMGSVRQQTMNIKLVATGETKVNRGVAESTVPKYARLKLVIQFASGLRQIVNRTALIPQAAGLASDKERIR